MASPEQQQRSPAVRITAMASGNGSNFQAVLDAVADGGIPGAQVVRLFVNRKKAYALERASRAGVPSTYYNLIGAGFQKAGDKDPESVARARAAYDAALAALVLEDRPDLVLLAGWMHVFSEAFLRPLADAGVKCINLHPALPGKYDGAGAIERAFEDFQQGKLEGGKTGIMIHYVIAEVDRGEPIMVREIECREGEELAQLEERIHAAEHELIVSATAQVVGEIAASKKAQKE
ncbi:hypothetical protein RB595_009263 [Gaeumannomyces hyphopodioides]